MSEEASDRPRKRTPEFDSTIPLDSPIDEAIALFLATPEADREFKTRTALAKHLNIPRMTVHRRTKEHNVLERANWLVGTHWSLGVIAVRQNWAKVVEAQIKAALAGNVKAFRFCRDVA